MTENCSQRAHLFHAALSFRSDYTCFQQPKKTKQPNLSKKTLEFNKKRNLDLDQIQTIHLQKEKFVYP